jgi:hypothetical protein
MPVKFDVSAGIEIFEVHDVVLREIGSGLDLDQVEEMWTGFSRRWIQPTGRKTDSFSFSSSVSPSRVTATVLFTTTQCSALQRPSPGETCYPDRNRPYKHIQQARIILLSAERPGGRSRSHLAAG